MKGACRSVGKAGCGWVVIETGRIVLSGDSAAVTQNPRVREAYLGL